jgi:predicted ATPase
VNADAMAGGPMPESAGVPVQRPAVLALERPEYTLDGRAGQAGQVTALRSLLRSARRVTVTGPPRSGKSALAATAVAAARSDFPDGTWTVPLGAVSDGALVAHVVARALRLPDRLGLSQLAALRTGLCGRRLLIILDDCDRVAQACASLAAELARSPGVHLVATAMAPLHVADERVYAVGGQRAAAPWPDRAAIGLAHQLCPPRQRLLWARLSVFTDWFGVADAVAAGVYPPLPVSSVTSGLRDLAARSVLITKPAPGASGTQYRLLPPTREYGAAMLREIGEEGLLLTWRSSIQA